MTPSRSISMQQIATRLGVSRATVSNALLRKGRLTPDLAERIRATAQEMGYVPSHAGRALRTGRTGLVGLAVPDMALPLFPALAQTFQRAAARRGLALMLADGMGDAATQRDEIARLAARGADAVVVVPLAGLDLDRLRLPVPLAVVESAEAPRNIAAGDDADGGRQIARHLTLLGHRRVVVLAADGGSTIARTRARAMSRSFAAAGVEVMQVQCHQSFEAGRDFALNFDFAARGVTACAATQDTAAIGVMAGLAARRIRVPQEVSVTGYDDVIWSRLVAPGLTTVRQDLAAIADHALAVAIGEASGAKLFPVALIERASSDVPPSETPRAGRRKRAAETEEQLFLPFFPTGPLT